MSDIRFDLKMVIVTLWPSLPIGKSLGVDIVRHGHSCNRRALHFVLIFQSTKHLSCGISCAFIYCIDNHGGPAWPKMSGPLSGPSPALGEEEIKESESEEALRFQI